MRRKTRLDNAEGWRCLLIEVQVHLPHKDDTLEERDIDRQGVAEGTESVPCWRGM